MSIESTSTPGRRRRRLLLACAVLALALTAAGCGGTKARGEAASTARGGGCEGRLAAAGVHGELAFIRNGGVSILHLPSCRTHVLVAQSDASAPLRFSADGRYLAYGEGDVIAARGTPSPRRPLGRLTVWAWSPQGEQLAGVNEGGGLQIWRPGGRPRTLIPSGWGAVDVAFSPSGDLLTVLRAGAPAVGANRSELWSVDPATGRRRLVYETKGTGDLRGSIAGFTPNGRNVLVWPNQSRSSSIAADGLPLAAIPIAGGHPQTLVPTMLAYRDYIATCAGSLVVAAGPDRYTTHGKRLVRLAPPSYRPVSLHLPAAESWTTPSCSRSGEIAAAAGPNGVERHFGLERRSIWLLSSPTARPRRIASPAGEDTTDELPRISKDGRYVLYIATRNPASGSMAAEGSLWVASLEGGRSRDIGPIARLGRAGNYYGHYGWASVTAWHQAATAASG